MRQAIAGLFTLLWLAGPLAAKGHDNQLDRLPQITRPAEKQSCLCLQACALGRHLLRQLPPKCSRLHDEVLYDNRASCHCQLHDQKRQENQENLGR